MPYWWWIVPALIGFLALSVLAMGLGALVRRRPYRALGGSAGGSLLLAVAGAALLVGLNVQTYYRLTYEQPVATVDLHQTGDKSFDATIEQPPTGRAAAQSAKYALRGDEWRMEARVLKWKPWANMLGLDARYRLNRLAGEYTDVAAERDGQHNVYDLPLVGNDDAIGRLSHRLDEADIVDTVYGSAALMPMADNARYELWMTQSGLVARPANDQAAQAVGNWK
jgi:hypothetical protein